MGKSTVCTLAFAFGLSAIAAAGQASPAGHWQGTIDIGEHPMSMTVDLDRDAKGAWVGSMTIVGSSSMDVPLTPLFVTDSAMHFGARLPEAASFDGHVGQDGSISGTASNAEGSAPFHLARSGEAHVNLPPPSTPLPREFAGDWLATVERDGKSKRIALKLASSADGIATATLVSVDRGNAEIPVQSVQAKDKQLTLESRSVSGKFTGTLNADGEIAGQWSERQSSTPLTFKHVATPPSK